MRFLLAEAVRFGKRAKAPSMLPCSRYGSSTRDIFRHPDDSSGPRPELVARAVGLVDYRRIQIEPDRIMLPSGMAVTLNGIAQGYVADCVADLLRARGWNDVLIDLGSCAASARIRTATPGQLPWRAP